MSKAAKKVLDEANDTGNPELELQEKQIARLEDLPDLCEFNGKTHVPKYLTCKILL